MRNLLPLTLLCLFTFVLTGCHSGDDAADTNAASSKGSLKTDPSKPPSKDNPGGAKAEAPL